VKLVQTLLVRDEADIVDAQIRHHLNVGVDFVIATDHESVDGTTDILEAFVHDGCLRRIAVSGEMHDGPWRTRMARLAADEYAADWVINTDADEFWLPRRSTLKELFAAIPEPYGVIFALSRHFAPLPEDDVTFVERMTVRVTPPVAINDPTSPYRPHLKVAHRADPSITISHGAHSASSDVWEALHHWHECDVLHFPFRSSQQWEHKGVRRARGDSQLGQYVTALLASEAGRSAERYAALTVGNDEIARGLSEESLATDHRLLEEWLGSPATLDGPSVDAAVISDSAAVRDADVVRLHRHVDGISSRVAAVERALQQRRDLPMVVAVAVITVLLILVALPEALSDHPYDPRPSRVFTHISLFIG